MTQLPDFDKLLWLAQNDPNHLDKLQKLVCEEAIESCDEGNRAQLLSTQHHLEQQLARCTNPYHRCNTAMAVMHEKFLVLNQAMSDPQKFRQTKADVIPFAINER
ncbi:MULTISPECIES: DUF3135 domain-containing protein [Shewanella]|uniref:DUF3135 domain-containing protein n=1 Tax=Shewanella TaxID=22 RepID=UPI00048DD8B0|nr:MULTISPECIES: DUF3135 domain-containing protein [Shewanella]QLE85127.1 DUF3135 domain-containing protein [Shewanella sp. Scap07]